MTRGDIEALPKLTTRDRALATAVQIINARAAEIEGVLDRWTKLYPDDQLGSATERSAYLECQLLARLITDRMSATGRAKLSLTGADK